MARAPRSPRLVLVWAALLLTTATARGESEFLLDPPDFLGIVEAGTFDVNREHVGKAHLSIERLDDGRLRMMSDSGLTAGPRTVVKALLAPVDGQQKLRPVLQESRSWNGDGSARGILSIDHERGVASCHGPDGELVAELALPTPDRVANVPLQLLFLPLVREEENEVAFQLFLCGGGPRFIDFTANVAPSENGAHQLVEVRYGPDFGFATMVARSFVPKLSFWFDPESPHRWMAHRLPLYGNGPEVFVVRDGVPVRWLGEE